MLGLQLNFRFFIFLLALGFAAYGNALGNGFVLDDHMLLDEGIIKNPWCILDHFRPGEDSFCYRPWLRVALTIGYAIFGDNSYGYHLINFLLLWLCAVLFYSLVFAISRDFWTAALAACFFLLHPYNSIFVNFITTVNVLLEMLFLLGSLLCVMGGNWVWSAIFFIFGLGCHESAILLPFCAWGLTGFRRTVVLWTIALLYFFWHMHYASFSSNIFDHYSQFQISIFQFFAGLLKLTYWYCSKLLYPSGIVFTWGVKAIAGLNGLLIFGFFALLGGSWITWRYLRVDKAQRWGAIWFAVGLIPLVLGSLAKPKWFLMIEPYWLFFSLMGFCLLLAREATKELVKPRRFLAGTMVVVILVSWIMTDRLYNHLWSNEAAYCQYWLLEFPGYRAIHQYLAQVYEIQGNWELAQEENFLSLTEHPADKFHYLMFKGLLMIKQRQSKELKERTAIEGTRNHFGDMTKNR